MELNLTPKHKNETNREYTYRILRDHIMRVNLLPGSTLNETELSDLFHVSRTPIHEAIIMLKEEYLAEVYPQSGSKVSLINGNLLKEGYFLRSLIEPEIIRTIAGNLSDEYSRYLRDNLEHQKQALNQELVVDAFLKLDDDFHRFIYYASGKREVWDAVKRVNSHYDRVRYLDACENIPDLNRVVASHQKILHILMIGLTSDFPLHTFYEEHLGHYKTQFGDLVEMFPAYFVL